MARQQGHPLTDPENGGPPPGTPFSTILLYVLGFMGILALLAYGAAWLLHRH